MSATIAQVANDIAKMTSTLNHILSLSKQIGGFNDGPHLREQLQVDVKSILDSSRTVKRDLLQLKDNDESEADEYLAKFEALRGRIQQELPPVVNKLKSSSADTAFGSASSPNYTEGLLDQTQLDGATDLIDILEQQVNAILMTMREVREIFGSTLEELQKQKHMVQSIETTTAEAAEDMHKGNEILEEAQDRQKGATKCILWILIILVLVAVAIVLIILSQTIWKKKKNPDTPIPTPSRWQLVVEH
jgi:predicted nucleic acid-binding Zn ribbon protein